MWLVSGSRQRRTQFCLVRRANEMGHVECLVDFGRANFLVPVPKVASLVEPRAHACALINGDRTATASRCRRGEKIFVRFH
jgi:hypothetical protein